MNMLAVILARAGSQGLKGKHLRPLCGRSVIEYTFDHAAQSRLLNKTVVSTDCGKIRELAQARSLQVIDRPAELATSWASVQDAMLHAMDAVESDGSFHADGVVVLYGNVPVREMGIIDRAVEMLRKTGCDSVRSF
jgi:N-acylneuraminate cytidylyltransferase